MTEDDNRDHYTEEDEAYFRREVEHAKQKAREMIIDYLFQFADDHRADHLEGDAVHHESERPLALAIDMVHDELLAWAREEQNR
jgi:hypothetical protein